MSTIRRAAFVDLDAVTAYRLLRLRVDVFVEEQDCAYPDLDGRDLEPATVHLWIDDEGGEPAAYLRILAEPGGAVRIGRVVTAAAQRGRGLAAELVRHAVGLTAPVPIVLEAQSNLTAWYEGLGFRVTGAPYLDDGILHTPMRLDRPC